MKLYRSIGDLGADALGGVVVIGNFDGIHLGHRTLIETAARLASDNDLPLLVMTFEPHPRAFFAPDLEPFRLTTFREKARLLQRLGVQHLLALRFDNELAEESAEDFIQNTLIDGLKPRYVVVGQDFRFGHGRKGDIALLTRMLASADAETIALDAVGDETGTLSSSRIRGLMMAGDVGHAAEILGQPVTLAGTVKQGAQRGRTISFPTANITLDADLQRPAYGVYAVRAAISEDKIDAVEPAEWWSGVANFGKRPTVDGVQELLEVHLFDVAPELYDRFLRVQLVEYIRPEQKFDSFDALKAQIEQDALKARSLLGV